MCCSLGYVRKLTGPPLDRTEGSEALYLLLTEKLCTLVLPKHFGIRFNFGLLTGLYIFGIWRSAGRLVQSTELGHFVPCRFGSREPGSGLQSKWASFKNRLRGKEGGEISCSLCWRSRNSFCRTWCSSSLGWRPCNLIRTDACLAFR